MRAIPELSLQFLGAAGTVTGSRYLLEVRGKRILIDCGLFQGFKQMRLRNWAQFPVDPASIHTVLLTHAHIDHSGYIPALVRQGFTGKVVATPGTIALCELLLPDSGLLQEESARHAKRNGYSKHAEPLALYTRADAEASLAHFQAQDFNKPIEVLPGILATFRPAGHILGAAQISIQIDSRTLHFTGDLGRANDPIMRAPAPLVATDMLICESTYGDRAHPHIDHEAELAPIIREVAGRGGVIVIPAFAVGRAQQLMLQIARLRARGLIPELPLYLNSPMAIDATDIYQRFSAEHRITASDCALMCSAATRVQTADQSKALNRRSGPMIIISASGMITGGRVVHHIEAFGSDPRNAILLAGFQAGGTRGALLASGVQSLRMFGREIPIRAEVIQLQSLSSHPDGNEIIDWLKLQPTAPKITYITHGEPAASDILRGRIKHELGWNCLVPEHLQCVDLKMPK